LIVPGTTISLTLMPTYIEVRDKGIVKKKIPLKSKSFEDVSLELEKYFRYLNKRLAPGVLEDVLVRIGLPKAKRVVAEVEIELKTEEEPEPEVTAEEVVIEKTIVETPMDEPPKEKGFFRKKEKKKVEKEVEVTISSQNSAMSGDERGTISADDFDDITDALQAVEALSDSFMAPITKQSQKEEKKPVRKVSISLEGQDEIRASQSTYARTPEIDEIAAPVEEELDEIVAYTLKEDIETEEIQSRKQVTPTHQIRPIIDCKALLLGEKGVGKRTILNKAELIPIVEDVESKEPSKYIFGKIVDAPNHRVDLHIWSFDLAVQEKLPRKEYYDNAGLLLIVYAASDRWSFESIDFWIRESSISCEEIPPLIIIGNKIDLRSKLADDSGEEPVSYEEGFQYAEELAKKLGNEGKLHPVAFIETSAETGENIEDVFETAAELYENSLQ